MATNLSGNTLTLGSYALTASQSGNVCVNNVKTFVSTTGNSALGSFPLSTIITIQVTRGIRSFTGSWSGLICNGSGSKIVNKITSTGEIGLFGTYWLMRIS